MPQYIKRDTTKLWDYTRKGENPRIIQTKISKRLTV
jgi:hypothetical protein